MLTQELPVISRPMIERIIRAACAYWDITEEELLKRTTEHYVAYRRKVCFFLIKKHNPMSYGRIAARFTLKDPGYISRSVEEIEATKNIYTQTSHDLNAILQIANNLADRNNQFQHAVDGK